MVSHLRHVGMPPHTGYASAYEGYGLMACCIQCSILTPASESSNLPIRLNADRTHHACASPDAVWSPLVMQQRSVCLPQFVFHKRSRSSSACCISPETLSCAHQLHDARARVLQEGLANLCLVGSSCTLQRARIETSMPRKRGAAAAGYDKALESFFRKVGNGLPPLPPAPLVSSPAAACVLMLLCRDARKHTTALLPGELMSCLSASQQGALQ